MSWNDTWGKFFASIDNVGKKLDASTINAMFASLITNTSAKTSDVDANGNTVLMQAASRGLEGLVSRLVKEFYADFRAANKDGMTALHMAARGGFKAICDFLSGKGADTTKKNKNGQTPADLARENGFAELAKSLGTRAKQSDIFKTFWNNTQR